MTKPTIEELTEEFTKKDLGREDALAFLDHHEARGWKLKTGPMKSWRAAVSTWARNAHAGTFTAAQEARHVLSREGEAPVPVHKASLMQRWLHGGMTPYKYHPRFGVQLVEGGAVYYPACSPGARKAMIAGIMKYYDAQGREPPPETLEAIGQCRAGKLSASQLLARLVPMSMPVIERTKENPPDP